MRCERKTTVAEQKAVVGTLDEFFIEDREPAADAAHCGLGHYRILLCGAVSVVGFRTGGLRRAHVHSLSADYHSTSVATAELSTLFEFQQWYSTSSCQCRSWKK